MELPRNLFVDGFANSGEAIFVDGLTDCRDFIAQHFAKAKNFNAKRRSYWFRFVVSNRIGREITNGEFIASMILEGFDFQIVGSSAIFNVTEASIRVLFSDNVLSLGYKVIKLLKMEYGIEFGGTREFNDIVKGYNSFEMPLTLRLETILLNTDEARRFAEFVRRKR